MQISRPAGNGIAGWKHAVLHFLHEHHDPDIRRNLRLGRRNGIASEPRSSSGAASSSIHLRCAGPSTADGRLARAAPTLLGAARPVRSRRHRCHLFRPQEASSHYLNRCERDAQTVQATFLVDTAQSAVIDVHCSAKWPNGTNVGPQVALRNAGDLLNLAADKVYELKTSVR